MNRLRSVLTVACSLYAFFGLVPTGVGAYATVGPPPNSSTGSGLPDGRVYEEASPANKHGFQAGAAGRFAGTPLEVFVRFSVASPDGNAISYGSEGPAAETNSSGVNRDFVAEHTSHGWTSRSAASRGLKQNEELSALGESPIWRDYSPDLSHLAYIVNGGQVSGAPAQGYRNIYLLGSNPLEEPTWLLETAFNASLNENPHTEIVGMAPDASIVYIAYEGRLLRQDASRTGWGLYEYRNGTLSEAGVLPDGSVPASGALPVATSTSEGGFANYNQGENNPASQDNQLSEDGRRVFFVSSGELYVHEIEADGTERSVLVSASQLPGHLGEAAPHGAVLFENLTKNAGKERTYKSAPTYAYASSDGSHVFFQSEDQLTSLAPSGTELKIYDFDVDTGSLEYLPGVALGGIVTAAKDGSSFVFVSETSSSPKLDRWSAGSNGGSVSQIAQLPGGGFVGPGRLVDDDSVLVFQALAPIAGFNNAGSEQVYRYDIQTNELGCISCPPAGVKPSGDAYLSAVDQYFSRFGGATEQQAVNDVRGVSSDGKRIFFASPDPLVSRDTNGDFDTYEWENGTVFLLSSGTSSDYSLFLDNSETGGDVFFATSDELVQGDNDAGFDVYDARIPRAGDNPPPSAVPCSGDVCQGPPSVAQLLGAPPSATFNGAGNLAEEQPAPKAKSIPKRLTTAQKRASALSACHRRKSKHRRVTCEKQARKRYPAAKASTKHDSRRGK
jgi:hypothetical protein